MADATAAVAKSATPAPSLPRLISGVPLRFFRSNIVFPAFQWHKHSDSNLVHPVPEGAVNRTPPGYSWQQCGWLPSADRTDGSFVKPGDYVIGPQADGTFRVEDRERFEREHEELPFSAAVVTGPLRHPDLAE